MSQIIMEVTGHMAEAKAGDRVWVLNGDRLPTERTILSVDYEHDNISGVWQVEGLKVTMAPDPDEEEEYDEDDWDWIHRSNCFATEKEALEQQQAELETDIQDKEQELADLRTKEHAVRRRLMVLNAEEGPFDGD